MQFPVMTMPPGILRSFDRLTNPLKRGPLTRYAGWIPIGELLDWLYGALTVGCAEPKPAALYREVEASGQKARIPATPMAPC